MLSGNILSFCIGLYLVGYIVEKRFSNEVGALLRLAAAGLFLLVLVLRLLGFNVS